MPGVSGVVPNYQLWRVDQLRSECANGAFLAPPEADWDNIVATLRFLRDEVVPAVGPVEVVSGYRDAAFNACVRGASRSAHMAFRALDLVPTRRMSEPDEIAALVAFLLGPGGRSFTGQALDPNGGSWMG